VIKYIPGKSNPADPATRRPNFLPDSELLSSKRTLLVKTDGGLRLQELSLDDEGPLVEIGEVQTSVEQPTVVHPDVDFFFCPPSKELFSLLLKAYLAEPPDPLPDGDIKKVDGFWWSQGRIFVLSKLRPRVLKEFHDGLLAGHLGSLKTLEVIGQTLTWPGIQKDVLRYTKSCFSCQRAKQSNQKPPGLMKSLQVPD
jgi:hypothetical protein